MVVTVDRHTRFVEKKEAKYLTKGEQMKYLPFFKYLRP